MTSENSSTAETALTADKASTEKASTDKASTDKASTAAMALRKLARAGSAKQMLFAARDMAGIVLVSVLLFVIVSKPVGLVIGAIGVVMFATFAFAVLTSGARLQKIVRDPSRIASIILANTTKRSVLARAWIVGSDNRSVTIPFLSADADVVAATFGRAVPAKAVKRFDDETSARAEAKRLSTS